MELAIVRCLWYGSLGRVPVQVILVRKPASTRAYDIALTSHDGWHGRSPEGDRTLALRVAAVCRS